MLYDPDNERVHVVNATGAAIWELCDGETEGVEMVTAICELTGLPREVVEEDVGGLLRDLEEAHLIVVPDESV